MQTALQSGMHPDREAKRMHLNMVTRAKGLLCCVTESHITTQKLFFRCRAHLKKNGSKKARHILMAWSNPNHAQDKPVLKTDWRYPKVAKL
jgi:hypothetical protein